ncbi:hypothetical protein L7F22_048323 [Adiantum nelumboides]|nr:hypothetical protein [Adiantum nelumboides]
MSGARLCNLLVELGYEDWQLLDADSFEWPFQYQELVVDGKLLEGDDLDFAYDSISAFSIQKSNQEAVLGAEESLKEVRDATALFKSEAADLQKRIHRLQLQLDVLTGQASALIQGRRARNAAALSASE